MTPGKRYQVFSIVEPKAPGKDPSTKWVKAGSAWMNRDGSINVYLDVLPIDGKLHVREPIKVDEAPPESFELNNVRRFVDLAEKNGHKWSSDVDDSVSISDLRAVLDTFTPPKGKAE